MRRGSVIDSLAKPFNYKFDPTISRLSPNRVLKTPNLAIGKLKMNLSQNIQNPNLSKYEKEVK